MVSVVRSPGQTTHESRLPARSAGRFARLLLMACHPVTADLLFGEGCAARRNPPRGAHLAMHTVGRGRSLFRSLSSTCLLRSCSIEAPCPRPRAAQAPHTPQAHKLVLPGLVGDPCRSAANRPSHGKRASHLPERDSTARRTLVRTAPRSRPRSASAMPPPLWRPSSRTAHNPLHAHKALPLRRARPARAVLATQPR